MSTTALPTHYYLDHGLEIFDYIETYCAPLLPQAERHYIENFRVLGRDEQCLLIRLWTRKPQFLKKSSLVYPEINAPLTCLDTLQNKGFANEISFSQADDSLFAALTKPELLKMLKQLGAPVSSSTSKTELVDLCQSWRIENQSSDPQLRVLDDYIERSQQAVIDYLLFLFFGDLRNRFQRFAMRDLGVLVTKTHPSTSKPRNTRQTTSNREPDHQAARFTDIEQARHEFDCHRYLRELNQARPCGAELMAFLTTNSSFSSASRDQLILKFAEQLAVSQTDQAIKVWQLSDHADALEKRLRLQYQIGQKDQVKAELEQLQQQSLSPVSEIFVSDFYARKFTGKRTSVYTDMLNNAADSIGIDELYLNASEQGVIDYYARQGVPAQFVENTVWRAFFALIFWDLLFEQDGAQANEFDQLPLTLQRGDFFSRFEVQIKAQLEKLNDAAQMGRYLSKIAVSKHGYPSGLFQWSESLLATLLLIVRHAVPGTIANLMLAMAKDYQNTKDGYPDLLVVDDDGLRFEEIKAPGDVLRPNQLVSINRLQRAGFNVVIRPTHWFTDPNQVYAVVDIETTGGRQSGNCITEVAVVKMQAQSIISEWSSLVKPSRSIPPFITQLTGISNAMVEDAPRFDQIADELTSQLNGCVFVAHNVGFDYGFIKAAYQTIGHSFNMPKLCTVRGARKAFPGLQSYSLGKLVQHFDIDLISHHRALDDARATAHLLSLIQAKA